MADRVLPNREELAASNKEVWTHALEVASQNPAIDLTTAVVLDHIRHLIVMGQLVDRETIDYEAAQRMLDIIDQLVPPLRTADDARPIVDAALPDGEV